MSEDNKQSETDKKPSPELSAEELKQVAGGEGTTKPDTITETVVKPREKRAGRAEFSRPRAGAGRCPRAIEKRVRRSERRW
jgi:hypothetical protein